MRLNRERITEGLRALGPVSPTALAKHLDADRNALRHHVRGMLADETLHASGNRLNQILALPDQKLDGEAAPPQRRGAPAKKSSSRRKPAKRKARAARPAVELSAEFIPAFTADSRLVLLNGGAPQIFSPQQTERIATLLGNYFEDA